MVDSDSNSDREHKSSSRKRGRHNSHERDDRRRSSHHESHDARRHRRSSREDRRGHREVDDRRREVDDRRRDDRAKRSRNETEPRNEYRNNDRSRHSGKKSSFFEDRKEPEFKWGRQEKSEHKDKDEKPVEKEKPNFAVSGKLLEDTNMVNGVVIKYSEPDDSRKPKRRWRLYPFKGDKSLPVLHIHRQSAYLMGRDRKIADIPIDHPSCSKQHAALQFRLVPYKKENGFEGKRVRPYIIDLESANGTYINNVKLEPRKYHELLERDVLKFGYSSREYVMLHEESKYDILDDDVDTTDTTKQE